MNVIEIAPIEDALTFARIEIKGNISLLAVTKFDHGYVTAVNLTEAYGDQWFDPVILFNKFGYTQIKKTVEKHSKEKLIQIKSEDLILPLELTESHVATATNFSEHAIEASIEEGPFLFAKLVTPTAFNAAVMQGDGLLDFEVELSFVTLTDVNLPEVPEFMGLILSNDITDRAILMRNLNPNNVTSGDGFTMGKSAAGYLPVGNLFVIPYDLEKFVEQIQLKLAVNGEPRQTGNLNQLIWNIDEIFRQTQSKEGTKWLYYNDEIQLPVNNGVLPKRSMILSGTPEGTIYNGISVATKIFGVVSWFVSGWNKTLNSHIIEKYIELSIKQQAYLQVGDTIHIQVNRLGSIKTLVIE